MDDLVNAETVKLLKSITGLEAQREVLGDEVVDPALESLREKLADLETQLAGDTPPAPAEECRLITILFSDVVGSTALAEKLDPEEWKEIVNGAHRRVSETAFVKLASQFTGILAGVTGGMRYTYDDCSNCGEWSIPCS